ncbi:MAG TPA: ATP-dependent DNA helicase, partial [Terriglobales bacterium]
MSSSPHFGATPGTVSPGSTATAPVALPSLHQFFAPGGILSSRFPQYEFRRGQLDMAQAVERALTERRHLIVEAGTGTGKTLAYLLPALRSGRRVIISTGTKNLQEQLFYKDIPLLEEALFGATGVLKVCYMKGRGNYLCRQKLFTLSEVPVLSEFDEVEQYNRIREWERTTITGDRAELSFLPENSLLWNKLDARSDNCTGQKCPQFEQCFITEMRRKALESDLIIVNHHLFFADLSIKLSAIARSEDGEIPPHIGLLPEAGSVIFDEAHELEKVATDYFGIGISNLRIDELCRDVQNGLHAQKCMTDGVMQALGNARTHSDLFFAALPKSNGRAAFRNRADFLEEFGDRYQSLYASLVRIKEEIQLIKNRPDEAFAFMRRAHELAESLHYCLEENDPGKVFWIEHRQRRGRTPRTDVFLQATPIDVSEILQQVLFSRYESVVLASATLAVSDSLGYVRDRL